MPDELNAGAKNAGNDPDLDTVFRISTAQQMAASCAGASLSCICVTPLDVVKIRLQSQQRDLLSSKTPRTSAHFTGTADAFKKIYRREGILAFWSGLSPALAVSVPATVTYIVTYEKLRLMIKDRYMGVVPAWSPVVAGGSARFFAVTLVSPLELVRTKMQSKRLTYREIAAAIRSLVSARGVTGVFRGWGSTLLRDVPFSAVYWFHYEYFKSTLNNDALEPSFWKSFLAGAMSGIIAATVTTPFDVVKTHQQIDLGEQVFSTGGHEQRGKSFQSVVRLIVARHGLVGLFAGVSPRLAKIAPSCAIMMATFEYSKNYFYRYNVQHAQGAVTRP